MAKKQSKKDNNETKVNVEGVIKAVLPNAEYEVEIDAGGIKHTIMAYPAGKVRRFYIKMGIGDQVIIEMTPEYEMDKGRIIWKRGRNGSIPDFIKLMDVDSLDEPEE